MTQTPAASKKAHDEKLIRIMREHGIQHARTVLTTARQAKLPLSYACAFLDQESGGGYNVFGHDPVANTVKGGKVTKARYLEYKKQRKAGRGMQGVGPMQLTWYEFQDRADAIGGCHTVTANLTVGFKIAADLIKQKGEVAGVQAYNGDGPSADRYSRSVRSRQAVWHKRFV